MSVVVHPMIAKRILEDKCPKCLNELDVGYECDACGFDCFELATQYEDPAFHRRTETRGKRS